MSSPVLPPTNDRVSPGGLIDALERLRFRAMSLSVGYGIGLVVAAACGAILIGGLVDWLLQLPAVPRLLGLIVTLAGLSYLAYRTIWLPATTKTGLGDVAGRVEERFPAFEDRLRSSVSFLGDGHAMPADPYERQTIEQAGDLAADVRWSDVLQGKPAAKTLAAAAAGVILLVLLAVLLGPLANTVAGRLFDPLNPSHQWPRKYAVAPIQLPEKHAAGRPLTVTARLDKGDASRITPVVRYRIGDNGQVRQALMVADDDGVFTALIDPRLADGSDAGTMSVWVEAGDDQTQPTPVAVVRRPKLLAATLDVTPPPYVRDAARRTSDLLEGPATVGVGSELTMSLRFSKALQSTTPTLLAAGEAALPSLSWRVVEPGLLAATFTADQTLRFSVSAVGVDGFESDASPTLEAIVRPDTAPTVQIDEPRRNESRTAEAVVPLQVTATDDFGLTAVDLVVEKLAPAGTDGGWMTNIPLLDVADVTRESLATGQGERSRLAYGWRLSQLAQSMDDELEPGDVLEFYAQATDNYLLNGQTHEAVTSGRLRLTIISQQELNRRAIGTLQSIKDDVASTRKRQAATRRETKAWAEQVADKSELDAADREAAERLSRRQSREAAAAKRLAEQAAELQEQLEENNAESDDLTRLAERVADDLEETAEGVMRRAASEIDQARRAEEATERSRQADSAAENQQEADERLEAVMEQMEAIGTLRQAIDDISELLEQQKDVGERAAELAGRNVGQEAGEMSEADQAEAEELAAEQERLADAVEEALEQLEEQAGEQPADQEEQDATAEAMRDAAQAGRQQNVPGQQRQAAESTRNNQRQQGQQARQQAEIGLEIILNELRDAEREQLRQLQRELAELRDQIERLARLQAGHNADNLSIRGIEAEQVTLLLEAAGRNADQAVEATVGRLSAGQEQSERNARDLARTADESADDGGATADLLTRAALEMERAAVAIRRDDLLGAYEPPQVRALETLRQAAEAAAAEQERIQQEIEEQQREAIRQRLISLRDEQVADVNTPTTTLADAAAAGELNRRERLTPRATLAPRQGELADELADVTLALGEAGGTVFVYAGERVNAEMLKVQERLVALDTAEDTQLLQQSVVAGLTDLIDSLELEMNEQRFDRNSQPEGEGEAGGGGGEQSPPLPPAAEIKLFSKLQASVNERTKADDADAAALGQEQGELRAVLDAMLQKASKGQLRFRSEPAIDTLLPEEAAGEAPRDVEEELDERELLEDLLGDAAVAPPPGEVAGDADAPVGDASVTRLGDYLARARQRLTELDDAGPVTQAVQERIVVELDALAQQSQNQAQQSSSSSAAGKPGQPQPGQPGSPRGVQQQPGQPAGQPNQPGQPAGQQPGQPEPGQSNQGDEQNGEGPAAGEADLSSELEETLAEWGNLTPRERQAILDTKTDRPLESYRELVEAFNRALSEKEDE